jgi:copper chaperone
MATKQVNLTVDGMSCQHCVNSITKAVKGVSGVETVNVDLNSKKVSVGFDPGLTALQAIINVIEDQGYEVTDSTD